MRCLFASVCICLSLSLPVSAVAVCMPPSPAASVSVWSSLPLSVCVCRCLSVSICLRSFLSASVCFCLSESVAICVYLCLFPRANLPPQQLLFRLCRSPSFIGPKFQELPAIAWGFARLGTDIMAVTRALVIFNFTPSEEIT